VNAEQMKRRAGELVVIAAEELSLLRPTSMGYRDAADRLAILRAVAGGEVETDAETGRQALMVGGAD
jgi:hypothetical protein